jgi:phage terminase large subunit
MSLNPNLTDFWFKDGIPSEENFILSRHRVLYGGRASSKSWEFAAMAAYLAANYKCRFLCVRRFQNKIKESVYSLIVGQIERMGLSGFTILQNGIYHENGSEFAFYGIERNVDEIKSFEGATHCWFEEAHNLTKEQWDTIEPTIRVEGSELWISFNPRLVTDFVYERFIINTPHDSQVRLINYNDNPFISETMIRSIKAKQEEDQEEYEHIYLGVPNSDDDAAIIKRSWIEACIDAHKHLGLNLAGKIHVGFDVADSGEDRNCAVRFNGCIAETLDCWKAREDELDISSIRAHKLTMNRGTMAYDSIGVGAGVGVILKNAGLKGHSKFNAGGNVFNPDREYSPKITNKAKFENLKAQAWRDVADRMRNTYNAINRGMQYNPSELISISSDLPNIDALKSELCTPHKDYSKRGLDMVESKKEVKKRLDGKSHDLADAFIMAACPHLVKHVQQAINIYG